jgi:hypothetical protein
MLFPSKQISLTLVIADGTSIIKCVVVDVPKAAIPTSSSSFIPASVMVVHVYSMSLAEKKQCVLSSTDCFILLVQRRGDFHRLDKDSLAIKPSTSKEHIEIRWAKCSLKFIEKVGRIRVHFP